VELLKVFGESRASDGKVEGEEIWDYEEDVGFSFDVVGEDGHLLEVLFITELALVHLVDILQDCFLELLWELVGAVQLKVDIDTLVQFNHPEDLINGHARWQGSEHGRKSGLKSIGESGVHLELELNCELAEQGAEERVARDAHVSDLSEVLTKVAVE